MILLAIRVQSIRRYTAKLRTVGEGRTHDDARGRLPPPSETRSPGRLCWTKRPAIVNSPLKAGYVHIIFHYKLLRTLDPAICDWVINLS
jgi:hypothetical protein